MRAYVSCLLFVFVSVLFNSSPAGAQSEDRCFAVYDANRERVGLSDYTANHISTLLLNRGDVMIQLNAGGGGFWGGTNNYVYYAEQDCAGQAYISTGGITRYAIKRLASNTIWYPDTIAPKETFWTRSYRLYGTGACSGASREITAYPAYETLLPEYTAPFHIESEQCFTPEDPDPEQIINACVKDKSGALRIVTDPADCTPREMPISWVGQ